MITQSVGAVIFLIPSVLSVGSGMVLVYCVEPAVELLVCCFRLLFRFGGSKIYYTMCK